MIILEDDPVAEVAKLLKVEVYQVFYLAAQDEGLGQAHQIAVHRSQQYHKEGYEKAPDYVKEFCTNMVRALRRTVQNA